MSQCGGRLLQNHPEFLNNAGRVRRPFFRLDYAASSGIGIGHSHNPRNRIAIFILRNESVTVLGC